MNHKRALFSGLALLLLAAIRLSPAQAVPEPDSDANAGCTASQCHPTRTPKEGASAKAHGDCQHCHIEEGKSEGHPNVGGKTFTLAPGGCLECHAKVVDYDYLHPPVAAGDCLACHTFHAARPSLLADTQGKPLCHTCHPAVVGPEDTHLHGDVGEGKCLSCHTAHGSFFKHLFPAPYSTDFFNDFDEKQYALCFQCHKIDLLLYPTTSYNTKFRDGKKNLHYTHVNRTNRGRACKLCHAPHASRQPKLMNETISFGDWEMPLNFVANKSGGQCTPGCHSQKRYTRDDESPTELPEQTGPRTDSKGGKSP